ncbi:uncharacterized protein LOC133307989 [Gastrolobium bilobum]|uniref:uncharacterized protein LOC133307989 n=1 Tax=Gastrolobium bilobum TaxID=150636 RepID=UPI002AB01F57|nr:uncharacterized protein LOC133307989 [Gastrolobium bilobum]
MANEKDWDLSAIFRCCRTANFTATTATTKTPPITTTIATQDTNFCMADHLILRQEEDDSFSFPVPEPLPTNGFDEHPLLMNFKPTTITNTNTSGNNIKSYSTFGEQWMQQGYHPVPAPTNYTSIGASTNYQPQWHAQQPQPQPSQQQHQHNQVPQISPVILQNIRPPTPISRKSHAKVSVLSGGGGGYRQSFCGGGGGSKVCSSATSENGREIPVFLISHLRE